LDDVGSHDCRIVEKQNMPTTTIPKIGPVAFSQSPRAKHLSITIKPDQTVRVAIPKGVSLPTAQHFLLSKIPWIKKQLNKLKKLQHDYSPVDLQPIDKQKAKTILTIRLRCMANKYGFTYNKLFIRNQKTRWGSCSGKNNISLNVNLIRLRSELIDYVILHELVHTKIKNHSKKFWAKMDRYVGDGKELRKELKGYGLRG
jgi:predicted metal-dependent hydrolase